MEIFGELIKTIRQTPVISAFIVVASAFTMVQQFSPLIKNPIWADLIVVAVFGVLVGSVLQKLFTAMNGHFLFAKEKFRGKNPYFYAICAVPGAILFAILIVVLSIWNSGSKFIQLVGHAAPPWHSQPICLRINTPACRACPQLQDGLGRKIGSKCLGFVDGAGLIRNVPPRWSTYHPKSVHLTCGAKIKQIDFSEDARGKTCQSID